MFFSFSKDMGIDLGTANTLIYFEDKIALNEPSVIAVETYTGKLLAVGSEAKEMLGRNPENIKVVRPLEEGVISDFDMTAQMLSEFIKMALGSNRTNNKMRVVIGVPSGVTEVEKRAVEEVIRPLGAREVYVLEEPMAAAIGSGLAVANSEGCMICDIGGGTTDIAIIALGGIVSSVSIRHAGDKLDDAIVAYMRKIHGLHIGNRMAEELKMTIGCAQLDDEEAFHAPRTANARGRDAVTGLPKTVVVTSQDMQRALEDSIDVIIDGIKTTLDSCPPELAADIVNNGLVLAGGVGLMRNLDQLISQRTGMAVRIAENPFEAVVMGTGMALKNIEQLRDYIKNRAKRS